MTNSTRVLKNTISLYFRMIILTVISLFTVRIVLNSLGAADYGLYNVVAGFISMFNFISGTLTIASQRFFSVEIGKNDWDGVNKYFSVNFTLYIAFCILIVFFAETIGLWFVKNKMVIVPERMTAAVIVYQFSVITFIIGIIVSPHLALLIADENLSVYSFVSVFEGVFKIVVAYLLYITTKDKLVVYGFLLFLVSIIINGFYFIYTKLKYKEIHFYIVKDKSAYKEVFGFLNWNMIGALASVGKGQGLNIVINLFFGTVVNAARGVAFQINNVVSSFSMNFMKAIDPQITKTYASGDKQRFFNISCSASKISFFLLFIISMPLMTNMEYILRLWLKNVPEYTVMFAKLALIDALIMSLTDPISTGIQAIGKLKWYQIVVGGLFLLNVPVSYIILKFLHNPVIPFFVSIVVAFFMMIAKIIFFKYLGKISIKEYLKQVCIPVFVVSAVSVVFSWFLLKNPEMFGMLLLNVCTEVAFISILILFIGLNKFERKLILSKIPIFKKFYKD